jgi:DNA polymerase-3 subunit alpha
MKNNEFAHLHLHTESSALDGFGTAKAYAKEASDLGFEYIACTDHGNVDGVIEFQRQCENHKINSIVGCELYVVPDMLKKQKGERRGHLTVLVKNTNGWHTLCRWLTKANLEGYYSRPRCDYNQILESNLDGLIFMSACAGSVIRLPNADRFMHDLRDKAGEDNVLMEIMPHEIDVQHKLHNLIKEKYLDWPLIATNDCHYVQENDWEGQEVLLAIQTNATWDSPKRFRFGFTGLHLRTADEMLLAFKRQGDFDREDILNAMANSVDVAKECSQFKIEKQEICLPKVPYEIDTTDEFTYLEKCCWIGMEHFGLTRKTNYKKRLQEELDLIKRKGFARYFLIVQDFVSYCMSQGWGIGPGRGSVGGSLVAHLIHITHKCDPIKYNLSFSRFLSEHRIDWPDIDIDVEKRYRQQAVDYLYKTYGSKCTCGISTDMRMKSKAIIRDVGRVFEIPGYDVGAMANCIWEGEHEEGSAIEAAIEQHDQAKDFAEKYPKELEFALALEGQKRGSGRHAAGIVISGEDLTNGTRCVLAKRSDHVVCNWNMVDAEYCGLMKLDVLGLATISVIQETEKLINQRERTYFWYHPESNCFFYDENYSGLECEEVTFSIDNIPENDKDSFNLISNGHTAGLFQVSGRPLTELCKEMSIETFTHIRDANALVRPGPMNSGQTKQYIARKHGEKIQKIHPIYDEITEETYGVALFQEQISAIISKMAGMSESDADKIRKIISKKQDPSKFLPYKKQFIDGCKKQNTFSPKQAEEFFDSLSNWSRYGFNASHATAYAILAYDTAYLKAHYPTEFIAATLTYGEFNEASKDHNKHKQYIIDEAKELGLSIMPPKRNISNPTRWIAKDTVLYAPFVELKGIGENTADKCIDENICKAPKQRGFFKNSTQKVKKTKIEQILDDIEADNPDSIPDTLKDYLSFECFKQRPKRLRSPSTANSMQLSDFKIKEIKYRNEEVINCNDCELRKEATEPVLSSPGQYNVIVCLEAPGKEEDKGIKTRSGEIIRMGAIGPAGTLLWNYLEKYKIYRKHVHVTNVCRCYPSITKTPKSNHIEACMQWFYDELKHLDAKLILACGNTCVEAFTGSKGGINAKSGTREWIKDLNAWVVWCNHPSAVLRNKTQNEPIFEKGIAEFARAIGELKE